MKQLCSNCVHCGKIDHSTLSPYYCAVRNRRYISNDAGGCDLWYYNGSTTNELHGPRIEYTTLDESHDFQDHIDHVKANLEAAGYAGTTEQSSAIRTFATGATRNSDIGKPDYEGYLSPAVIKRYGEYMMKHQTQADGKTRPGDNWQKGITKEAYMKSMWRHFMDVWCEHRGLKSREGMQEALCALLFNTSGMLFEELKGSK